MSHRMIGWSAAVAITLMLIGCAPPPQPQPAGPPMPHAMEQSSAVR